MSPIKITIYLCLAAAILTEVIGTVALAASAGFSKLIPSCISIVCFAAAFFLLSIPLRTMPTGIVYAIWSGLSIVLVTAVAWVWTNQILDFPALVGMVLITAGVVVINAFSNSAKTHEVLLQGNSYTVAESTSDQQQIGSTGSLLSKFSPASPTVTLPPTPPLQVIAEGKFDWGWFKAYCDGSIEVEANGKNRLYRTFAELEWERKLKRRSDHQNK
jgi:small multidrug resistance pump